MTTVAYIGLGSNLDNPGKQLKLAVQRLHQVPQTIFLSLSPVYRSSPLGPKDQPDFLNAVAALRTSLAPEILLDQLQQIENQQLRVRAQHWGPRTIDLDILLYGSELIQTERLTVPHPHLRERNFVLIPLADITPELCLPDGTALSTLISTLASTMNQEDLEAVADASEFLP